MRSMLEMENRLGWCDHYDTIARRKKEYAKENKKDKGEELQIK